MNASTLVLTPASERLICDVVDNNCPLNLSEQPRIVIAAYCAVFLPWGFLALLDMINERWKTLRRVFVQGVLQIIIAIPTMAYTFYYIELQRADRDYKEMCAAIVAVCLSAFHFFRTAWGLWQTYRYWRWVRFCLERFIQHGYSLDDMEECQPFSAYWARDRWSYNRRLNELSLNMKVNNSVVDNEFVECDVPFAINYAGLYKPHKWFSSQGLFTPRHFADSSLRYMIPFLAQLGRIWLKDCSQVRIALDGNASHYTNAVIVRHAVRHAKMLTERDSNGAQMAANWSNMWMNILIYNYKADYTFKSRVVLPFGCSEKDFLMGKMYARYGSKISRLIDSLPQELFEVDDVETDRAEVVQSISAFHLESFLIFLDSKVAMEQVDSSETSTAQKLESGIVGAPDTHSHARSRFPALEASCINPAAIITGEDGVEEQTRGTKAEGGVSGSESNIHRHLIGNGDKTHAQFRSDPQKWVETHKYFENWPLKRVVSQKMRKGFEFKGWLTRLWAIKPIDFTIHLENLFSLAPNGRGYIQGKPSPAGPNPFHVELHGWLSYGSVADRESYYTELCGNNQTIRKVEADERVIPRCESQRQFWRLWDLPEHLPFALEDIDLQTAGRRGSIKFIGYVMEIVRDCLAKWVSHHVGENSDTDIWSPEMRTDAAYVEFESSKEFADVGLKYAELLAPEYFKNWMMTEQLLWEFQSYMLGLINKGECIYGPSSVKLMLLCMLGLPRLDVSQISPVKKFGGFRVDFDKVYQKPFAIYINFNRDAGRHGKVRLSITPLAGGNCFRFEWAKWIHTFESGMRVLTFEYEEDDLLPLSPTPTNTKDDDDAARSTLSDKVDSNELDDSIGNNAVGGDGVAMDSVADAELDANGVSPGGDHEDGVAMSAGCSCGCEYKLNSKAKRVFLRDLNGTKKFYWVWEGWRPQQAFKEDRYPILHDVRTPEKNKRWSDKEGQEQHGMGTVGHSPPRDGSEVGDDMAAGDVAFVDADGLV